MKRADPSRATAISVHPSCPDATSQWMNAQLGIRPELRFDVRHRGDESYVVIEDPVRCKFFEVGTDEYRFIASLNGELTVAQVVEKIQTDRAGSIDFEKAKTICQWLVSSNLAIGQALDNVTRLTQQAKTVSSQRTAGLLNPICFKLRLFNPNRALRAMLPHAGWFLSRTMLVIWLLVGLGALATVCSHRADIGDASIGILANGKWVWLLVVWSLLKVVHEIGHGIACRKYGGEVPDAGVLILLFTPLAFVNVTSSWRFPNRWHRIVVAAAGMYVELFVSFLAIFIWANVKQGLLADVCFNIFIAASVSTILFNANPLMRFDGYYILSDILSVPNLYPKGTRWFGDRLKRTIFGTPAGTNISRRDERVPVAIYGTLAFCWKILVSLSLIMGASVVFHGAGIVLAVFGIGLWFGWPLVKQFKNMFGPNPSHHVNYKRTVISSVMLLLFSLSLFTVLRGPAIKSAPAIVQFKDEQLLRANADGFVDEILVQDGQDVLQGDVLIKLVNPELEVQRVQLQGLAEEALIQTRIYRQTHEAALAQAEQKKHESLLVQLEEKTDQLRGLTVTAPFNGFVFRRNLDNRIGVFVHQGDGILGIARRQAKQIVVSIDQSDLESIKENKSHFLRVAFPGSRVFQAKLVRIDPRANEVPLHPSLCAHVGGPLPVRHVRHRETQKDESVELLAPRFSAELLVSPEHADQLRSGQRGRVFFSAKRQSLGSYLYLAIADWFRDKLEKATLSAAF